MGFGVHSNERSLLVKCPALSPTPMGIVVVTHVYPQQSGSAVPTHSTFPNVSSVLGKFLKREPKVLGTVQIMIALVMILFGIVLAVYADNISVYCGILFWGSISYISSGALSVAANNKLNRCLVNGALVMNIFSAIIAAIAIIIFSLDFVIELRNYYCSYSYRDTYDHSCERLQDMYQARSHGISGVLLLFSILEFIISICVSAFACNAVCYYPSEQVVYMPYTSTQVNNVTPGDLLIPAQRDPQVEIF
ncbi:hypothetical protein AAFF_G00427270 [Aldrovandia affinis]|uniref:Membrane-spanning 4-domains subfamily A member 4A-like n=1 Tax=Aldrovandia affinis TaxID=143900 RepID=A0AAD7WIS4_9TELE|nr:hypothetical protein AAFF_G00427270 [Aldrovandia affinis]